MKKVLLQAVVAAAIVLVIANAQAAVQYTKGAMDICLGVVVPTLFPFFVLSGMLIYSGFCESVAKAFRFCMRPLFNVGEMGASAFVIGLISGYPLGAITTGELYKNNYITKTEAERLLAFCNNSGPLFILASVGVAMYSQLRVGVALYVCHILAAISVGFVFRFYKRKDYVAPKTIMTSPQRGASEVFSVALSNAISNMLTVCGAVVFFSVLSQILLSYLPFESALSAFAAGVMEFVTGSIKISSLSLPLAKRLVLTAFVVGFAGLGVHLQVMAVVAKYELSLVPYLIGKLCHGFLASVYTFVYLSINPITEAVFKTAMDKSASIGAAYCGVVILICLIVALSLKMIKEYARIKP